MHSRKVAVVEQERARAYGLASGDRRRRALGDLMERLGWGPRETDYSILYSAPAVRLRAYGDTAGPAVLLIPAPIKRAYIWDLAPGSSVVDRLRRAGCRVYLLEWLDTLDESLGLADYADRLIAECVEAVFRDSGQERIFLVGHSLGATCAAIFATLQPERVRGLVLLGAPLHFAPTAHVLTPLVLGLASKRSPARSLPGATLTSLTLAATPLSFGCSAWLDRFISLSDPVAWHTLKRVERWTLDEFALPGRLVADMLQALYRDNAFVRGTLVLNGRPARPEQFAAPVLAIADPYCSLAPPAAVEPFLQAAGSADVDLWRYRGETGVLLQHLGMLVGRSAQRVMWPRIAAWILERCGPGPGAHGQAPRRP